MDTKWKGWTARRPVKICCAVLIPVMAVVFMFTVFSFVRGEPAWESGDLLFAKFDNGAFFYDTYVPQTYRAVTKLLVLRDEAYIRDMGCLEWRSRETGEIWMREGDGDARDVTDTDDIDGGESSYELLEADYYGGSATWGAVKESELGGPRARRMVDTAIESQLDELGAAREDLARTAGLYYYCEQGGRTLTNLADTANMNADFFRAQPVYFMQTEDREAENNHGGSNRFDITDGGATVYIAFSDQVVAERNAVWAAEQKHAVTHFSVMIAVLAVALALLIVLMAGAGRVYGAEEAGIRFTPLDRPWLDAGLAVLTGYEILVFAVDIMTMETAWNYDNNRWLYALCVLLPLLAVPPFLWWTLSFTKRVKAGKWWRHTLCYALLHWCYVKVRGIMQSLWAGFPLTGKVMLLGIALFMAMLFCVAIDSGAAVLFCMFVSALAVCGMLRHARRLRLVGEAAKIATRDGRGGETPRPAVKGGILGDIASSINNISGGINGAVTERLKSERFKTELITNVSHDIRTPLTSVITYADLLKNEGLSGAEAGRYLDVIIQKSARLKTLTDDLFEASKAASGSVEVNIAELDLADLVRQVLGELEERVTASGLDFRLDIPEHARVLADGRLMWRVMENLFSNVFKYALKGSRVYVDIARQGAGSYRLDIKNISERALNVDPMELTERFKRGDDARSGEGGSGLGLSIAQSFVQAQSGGFALSIDGDLFKASVTLPAA